MESLGWARCTDSIADVLRRGAWYRVLAETPDGGLMLEVERQRILVSRRDVQLRPEPPTEWSIVVRTGVMRPTLEGTAQVVTSYAVCPDCRQRQVFEGEPDAIECQRCGHVFDVDWSEIC